MSFKKLISKIGLTLSAFAIVVFAFSGCGIGRLQDNPATDAPVFGNGGLAVTKGDYVYYVNGYTGYADVGDTNNYGSIQYSSIYRTKLIDGKVSTTVSYDNDNNVIFDKTAKIDYSDVVVPKVAGFEYTSLYIFGDFIYYTSPHNLKDKTGKVLSEYIDFYRAKLDRSGSVDLLYTTDAVGSSVSHTMYKIGDNVYQIILDGDKLVVNTINIYNKVVTRTVEDAKVTSATLPKYSNSNQTINNIDYNIYYTINRDDFVGNIIKKVNLIDKTETELVANNSESYKMIGTSGDYLYYTYANSTPPSTGTTIYYNNLKGANFASNATQLSNNTSVNAYWTVDEDFGKAILYGDGTNIYFKQEGQNAKLVLATSSLTFVATAGNNLYYIADSALKRIDFVNQGSAETVIVNTGTVKSDIANNFDVMMINGYETVYYYLKYATNNYLQYQTNNPAVPAEGDATVYSHFIGELLEVDYLTEASA